ncbi:coiled-coil domain-containing protein 103 [Cyclospora cayetanensis]|uniref:Coiled-coil domain-containing protein 103 n=1 Tax=Cyclospora cayetanensis TaxID=88456 RepID=A0A6P6RZK6_9EIME|nr:coiled-coil domain-containing protein 103 [Cyclospora cayetanensis]
MPLEPRLEGLYRRQVGAAVAADERRQLEDTTKKRAIVSAANYEEFRALVGTCHLKPMAREEMQNQPQRQFNRHAGAACGFDLSSGTVGVNSSNNNAPINLQLRNQAQLRREWEARDADPEDQCRWLLQQPQESLQQIFSMDIEPQLLLHLLRALASHISSLAALRCSSCCCCCQTRSASLVATAKAVPTDESAFCCRIAYRVFLTAGFLSFLAQLRATAKAARLLLKNELEQVALLFRDAFAALHSPVGPDQIETHCESPGETRAAHDCCCNLQKRLADTSVPGAAKGDCPGAEVKACCRSKHAMVMLLHALGAPKLEA